MENNVHDPVKPDENKVAMRVSAVSIVVNLGLALLKLIAGMIARSGAMVSDAVHSASDVFSTFVVIVGIRLSGKKSDADHPYGHERMECVAAIVLAAILAITGFGIGVEGIRKIIGGNYGELEVPGMIALIAALVSIAVKEWMYWYTRAAAKKINSGALMADAWHHRSDSLSSIGAFAGILGARMGFPILDPVASVIICVFIEKAAVDIFKDAVDKLVDKACPEELVKEMNNVISERMGVCRVDDIKTRLFGSKIYVDVEIAVDGEQTLNAAHKIAEDVHDAVETKFENVKHCMVHVNPLEREFSRDNAETDI
ncbi:MAG: cation transporter [Oscillospiraceae bacterium]|nr:cation transporter [Oscillospiraceae bacterium]